MNTKIKVVVGANMGDEGKGYVTDYFSFKPFINKQNILNVLSNGGSQRGHTVSLPSGKRHVFRHFGSGTFLGAYTYLPKYYIVNPMNYVDELRQLINCKIPIHETYIHPDCLLTTPFDMVANQMIEESRGDQRHGSCGVGIWETILRDGITVCEFFEKSDEEKAEYLRFVRDNYFSTRISSKGIRQDKEWESIIYSPSLISNYIYDFNLMIRNSLFTDDSILNIFDYIIFENGQGLLLDQNIQGYGKNTTPSNTGLKNPAEMINKLPNYIDVEVCYVTRTYMTRHGAGRFDTEYQPEKIGLISPDKTNQTHPFQGKLRYGVLDWNATLQRAIDDFQRYGKPEWNMSFFFTHTNECGIPFEYKTNFTTYSSDGITRDSVKIIYKENKK